MKITELKDEEMFEALADLIEPAGAVFGNEKIKEAIKAKKPAPIIGAIALRSCKKELKELLAAFNCTPVEEYHCTLISILKDLNELIEIPEVSDFFTSVLPTEKQSGSVTENIAEAKKI